MKKRRPLQPAPIRILGARSHNLKNISVSIPIGRLTVVTGVSGSGKSSLAFDTLYAEGQRRYVGVALDVRAPVPGTPRPAGCRLIEPVPPCDRPRAEERGLVTPARPSAPQTEIHDSLRLLFAHGGTTFCPECGAAAVPGGVDRAVEELCASEEGRPRDPRGPGRVGRARAGEGSRRKRARHDPARLAELKRSGFFRAVSPEGGDGRDRATRSRRSWTPAGCSASSLGASSSGSGPPRDRLRRRDRLSPSPDAGGANRKPASGPSAAGSTARVAPGVPRPHAAAVRLQLAPRRVLRPARGSGA